MSSFLVARFAGRGLSPAHALATIPRTNNPLHQFARFIFCRSFPSKALHLEKVLRKTSSHVFSELVGRAFKETRKEARKYALVLHVSSLETFPTIQKTTAMQKADGLRLFQFKFCLWFLLGWGATDGAVLSGEENAPDAVAGQVKSGEWKVESLREGGALRAQGRRKKEGGRRAVRPLRGRDDSGGGAAGKPHLRK